MYSFWSTRPVGAWLKKLSKVSRALRASSWVGELGAEDPGCDCKPVMGVPEEGGAIEPLLLLWCKGGEEMAESMPKGGGISWIGDSKAEEGAVTGRLYFGVRGSPLCEEMKDGSIPSMGKV